MMFKLIRHSSLLLVILSFINTLWTTHAVSQEVISTAGDHYSNTDGSISATIGEMTAIETASSTSINLIITQGFQQNDPATTLPLQLIQFTGYRIASILPLKWVVQNENGIIKYNIQRSVDGKNFTTIGAVMATSQIASEKNYTYTDRAASGKTVYSRLEIFDKDGSKFFSWIIKINGLSEAVKLYPMPVTNSFFIEINALSNVKKEVRLINSLGVIIFSKSYILTQGLNKLEIDIRQIPAGTYYLTGFDKAFQLIKL